jgi:predicted nucleotidyltransferase
MTGGAPWRPGEPRLDMPVVAICGVMDRTTLIDALKTYDAVLRENGATSLFIFGSRALGTDRPDSDLDLFIDYNPAARVPNIFRLMQIEAAISETLGIPVTITTRNALHPLMKDNIERDVVQVL